MTKPTDDESDPLPEVVDAALHLARRLGSHQFRNPDIVPLSQVERLVIRQVHRNPGLNPSGLAKDLALLPSNASSAVRGLIEKGQLRRAADPVDGRSARLYLTSAAEESIKLVHREWRDLLDCALVPDSDLETTLRTLAALNSVLDRTQSS